MAVERNTVDLSHYPDLVVIYLGMRVNALAGIRTLFGMGPKIEASANAKPEGLLSHEAFLYSLVPPHLMLRQYWRDFETLETWTRSEPHRAWWKNFLGNSGGTGFWHETYSMKGGVEAIYDDIWANIGLLRFAPKVAAKGTMFSARRRLLAAGHGGSLEGAEPASVFEEAVLSGNG
jgi:hypothetical protein